MQRLLFVFLLGAMVVQGQQPSQPSPAVTPAETARQQRVKEQAIVIPQGATVEVRLLDGKKLRGRLGQLTNDGLAIRSVFENKIEERTISFADIKSVRYYNSILPRMTINYIIIAATAAASIALAATR